MDTTIERILNLLKTKGIKDKDFVSAIGIYSSALSEWKSGKSVSYKPITTHIILLQQIKYNNLKYGYQS